MSQQDSRQPDAHQPRQGELQPGAQPSPSHGGQHQQQGHGTARQHGDTGEGERRETTLDDDSGSGTPER